jgi:hypothetical protein
LLVAAIVGACAGPSGPAVPTRAAQPTVYAYCEPLVGPNLDALDALDKKLAADQTLGGAQAAVATADAVFGAHPMPSECNAVAVAAQKAITAYKAALDIWSVQCPKETLKGCPTNSFVDILMDIGDARDATASARHALGSLR